MINLLNFARPDLSKYFVQLGEKPFRAIQLFKWIYKRKQADFSAMTDVSLKLREYLQEHTIIKAPAIAKEAISVDGTRKWLFKLADNNYVETVFIPEENRGTLCVSSQVGCPLGCSFCATGTLGFKRNLTVAEIIGQLWEVSKSFTITNVVMMGMGEPLLNFSNVIRAVDIMLDDMAYGLSKQRVTISTSGIVPIMKKLRDTKDVALAVSLHAPTDELRNDLVPINRKYPLAELLATCKDYYKDTRRVTFEYAMLRGVNDSTKHAKQLVQLLQGIKCKINLIPYNSSPGSKYQASRPQDIDDFRAILFKAGFNTIVRKTRGSDIAASCGQLVGCEE
jgi:23S rRNA (adenine2503-C2)-methyltransferase